ncbi:MAG: enoyl-CoA hydratase [Pseudomonadota bacterium]
MEKPVLYEEKNGVALITLNRPEKRNAISQELLAHLYDALERVAEKESIRAAVLTGAGPAFCAGLDLTRLATDNLMDPRGDGSDLLPLVARLAKPLIGAVNGAAMTGGFELALNCDFLLASETARFADTHVKMGIHPGWGMSQLLQRKVGLSRALQMSLTGDFLDAPTALAWGLVNEVLFPEALVPRALEIAGRIAENNQEMVPLLKSLLERGSLLPTDQAMELEHREFRAFLKQKGILKT